MWKYFLIFFFPALNASFSFAATGQVDLTNTVPDIATSQGGTGAGAVVNWVQNFYQFSLIAGVFLAVGVITWAGLKYALAAGNPSGQSDARDQILQALLGLILLFGAYLILFTINPNLINLRLETLSDARVRAPVNSGGGVGVGVGTGGDFQGGGGRSGGAGAGGCFTADCITDTQARQQLTTASNDAITFNATPPQTSLEGMRQNTINEIVNIQRNCGCNIVVTGGTEGGHSAGANSHANGYKVDLGLNTNLNNYVERNFTPVGIRSNDGARLWRAPNGTVYARESNHWDILVRS